MSEIVSFGQCSCAAAHGDADTEAQSEPKINIEGVDPERVPNSDCALLLYEIQFAIEGKSKIHRGIVAAVYLEELTSGRVLPLELPDEEEIARHLHNLEVCKTQNNTISALYTDPRCVLEALGENEKQRPADVEISSEDGTRCRVWKVANNALLLKVQAVLDTKSLILLHGRSLYEGMLRYRDECRDAKQEYSGKESFNYAAIALSNIDDFTAEYGMEIGPVISTCSLPQLRDFPLLLGRLGEFFNIDSTEIDSGCESVAACVQQKLNDSENPADIILCPGGKDIYSLQLRTHQQLQKTPLDEKQLSGDSAAVLYQRLVLNHILEVSPEELHNGKVFNMPESIAAACEYAAHTENCIAFFAPGPSISQIRDIAWDDIQVPAGLIRCNPLFPSDLVDFSVRD